MLFKVRVEQLDLALVADAASVKVQLAARSLSFTSDKERATEGTAPALARRSSKADLKERMS